MEIRLLICRRLKKHPLGCFFHLSVLLIAMMEATSVTTARTKHIFPASVPSLFAKKPIIALPIDKPTIEIFFIFMTIPFSCAARHKTIMEEFRRNSDLFSYLFSLISYLPKIYFQTFSSLHYLSCFEVVTLIVGFSHREGLSRE